MKRTRSRVGRWTPLVALFVVAATLGAASGTEAQTSTITFASLGDFGVDDAEHDEVAAMINSWSPDFIITQGDNRYDDENPTFDDIVGQRYCDYLAGVQSGPYCDGGTATENRFFPSTGNHDYLDGGGIGEYLEYFDLPGNELYYDFVKGPVHFFVMDSGPTGSFDATQQNWVQSGLQSSTAPWQVVSFHHAPYSSGEDHGSTANTQIDFAAWGADAVIAAHDHTYERLENDGIVYFVNGLGGRSQDNFGPTVAGSQFRYNDAYGAMRVTASLSSMILEFWAVVAGEAQLIDSHTLTKDALPQALIGDRSSVANLGVVDRQVAAGSDDAEQATNGSMDLDSSDLELVDDPTHNGDDQTVGIRFTNLRIPKGATIANAYLRFTADESDSGVVDLTIQAHDTSPAPTFTATAGDITDRLLTSTSVEWSGLPAWSTGSTYDSPDVSSIVEEIVNLDDWASGNAIAFIITGQGERTADSYDGSTSTAPLLHIEYMTSAGSGRGNQIFAFSGRPPAPGWFSSSPLVRRDQLHPLVNLIGECATSHPCRDRQLQLPSVPPTKQVSGTNTSSRKS